jgi:hypothetical protein
VTEETAVHTAIHRLWIFNVDDCRRAEAGFHAADVNTCVSTPRLRGMVGEGRLRNANSGCGGLQPSPGNLSPRHGVSG